MIRSASSGDGGDGDGVISSGGTTGSGGKGAISDASSVGWKSGANFALKILYNKKIYLKVIDSLCLHIYTTLDRLYRWLNLYT